MDDMVKIINGKRYNTKTATEVAERSHGNASDFQHFQESLYLSPNGQWFVAGEGGAMSHYSVSAGQNCSGGGSDLRLLTPNEAQEWLENENCTREIEMHFKVEEG